jgi:hypothetical protein
MGIATALGLLVAFTASAADYPWFADGARYEPLSERFSTPHGFARVPARGFGEWVRHLPLHPRGSPVRSYLGRVVAEAGDPRIAGVVTMDVGDENLQQCADAILRLRAEYLWQSGRRGEIAFRYTSGHLSSWLRWAGGWRPRVRGSRVRWLKRARRDSSRESFRRYLVNLFRFAGSLSLAREGRRVAAQEVLPGDFLSLGGSPGHAVMVLDVARSDGGETRVLLGQSYMPAQEFHVLRAADGSPWFGVEPHGAVKTPMWGQAFPWGILRRF